LPPGSTVLNDAGKPIDISLGRQGKAVGFQSAGGFADFVARPHTSFMPSHNELS